METIRGETNRSDRKVGRLRWVARLVLTVPLAIAWFVAIGNAVNDLSADFEGIILVVGLIVATVVAIIAWVRERLGGLLLIGLAVVVGVLSYLASNPHNVGAGVFTMLPLLVSGVLFVMVDHLEHRNPG